MQVIGQAATNAQGAFALGLTLQQGASNENAPIRVLSPGNGGSVSQSNTASSDAAAGNANWTDQTATQTQGGGGTPYDSKKSCCKDAGIQVIGQSGRQQGAVAVAATFQLGAKQPCRCKDDSSVGNSNEPTRVLSPGNDGRVRQSNEATSNAAAGNLNATKQNALQDQSADCGCKSDGIQVIGQLSKSHQLAFGLAAALQLHQLNRSAPERKESPGNNAGKTQMDMNGWDAGAGSDTSTDQSKKQVE